MFVEPQPFTCPPRAPEGAPEVRAPEPVEDENAPPAAEPPTLDELVAAARRLGRAFRRFRSEAGSRWTLAVSRSWQVYGDPAGAGDDPAGARRVPFSTWHRWRDFAAAEVDWGMCGCVDDDMARFPGLRAFGRALRRCRRLAVRADPNDRAQAMFIALVTAVLRCPVFDGPLVPVGEGREYEARVPYPTTLLDGLNQWADDSATPFVPTAVQRAILKALDGVALHQAGLEDRTGYDRRQLQRETGLVQLRRLGMVRLSRRSGFYRPDRPPPGTPAC